MRGEGGVKNVELDDSRFLASSTNECGVYGAEDTIPAVDRGLSLDDIFHGM